MTPLTPRIPPPLSKPALWVPLALGLTYLGALYYAARIYAPSDDTFIYLVYVKNLLDGNGLTYNGDRVWGFSSVLWTMMIWLVGKAGMALPRAANLLSGLSGLLVVIATYLLGRRMELSRGRALIPVVLVATAGDFAFYMGNGLETVFFTAALTFALSFLWAGKSTRPRLAMPVVMAVAVLARPEGALVCLLILAFIFGRTRDWKLIVQTIVVVLAILVPVGFVLKGYYGSWLPNTYYAKSGAGLANLPQGLQYFANFLSWSFVFLLPIALIAVFRFRALGPARWPLVTIFAVWIAHVTIQGGDNMVGFRAFVPILPLMFVLATRSLERLSGRVTATAAVLVAFYQIIVYNHGSVHGSSWNVEVKQQAAAWKEYYHHRVGIAQYLDAQLPHDAVIAVNAAGTIPYYTGLKTIDMLGLNNEYLARHGKRDRSMPYGHQVHDGEWVLEQKPDVILFGGTGLLIADRFVGDREIAGSPEFNRFYRAQTLPGGFHGYFLDRRGLPETASPDVEGRRRRAAVKRDDED